MARLLPSLMERFDVPGVAAVVLREGRPVWSGAFGVADVASGRTVTEDTLFRLESITKPVTAWGVMRLAEEGRVALDEPVEVQLEGWRFPDAPYPGEAITPRQLLSHGSGLPLGDFTERYPPGAALPELASYLERTAIPAAPAGEGFLYSNTGYHVLQLLVEHRSNLPFSEAMEALVLAPLGMETARFPAGARPPELAVAHDIRGGAVPDYVYPAQSSGGLYGTAADVARFAMASMAEPYLCVSRSLPARAVAALHAPERPVDGVYALVADAYGLGHFIDRLEDGRVSVWHGGQGAGWMTHLQIVPETGDAIILLANSQRAWPLFAHVLAEWEEVIGTGGVGMARLLDVLRGMAVTLAAGYVLAVALVGWRLAGVVQGRREVSLPRGGGWVWLAAGAGVAGVALWAARLDYLVLASAAPHLMGWVWGLAAGSAAAMSLAAVTPVRRE